jgi:iron complex transport system substrate-binding protein
MQRLNVAAVTVEQGRLSDVFAAIRTIGRAAGVPGRADALVGRIQSRLDDVTRAVSGRPAKRTLVIVGRRPGTLSDLIAASASSYLGDLVNIAGGVNVLADPALPQFPRISMETIVRLAPDVIIDAGDMGDTLDGRAAKAAQSLSLWRRQSVVPAAKAGRVHPVVSDAFVVPGPRVVDAAAALAAWLHGVPSR